MRKEVVNKLVKLGFLDSKECVSVYGQEIIDKFVSLLINKLKSENYKHYNKDFIKLKIKGKYYRINNNHFEIMINDNNVNNNALDLQYLFSKIIKDYVGVYLIEGYKNRYNYKYYYGYLPNNKLDLFYVVKQDKEKAYLRFNLLNIFYSIIDETTYLSYHLANEAVIIPLDQYRSGMLSYANKIKDKLDYNLIIDERNIPNFQKRKEALDKKVPLIIYIGKKDLKNKTFQIEYNNQKDIVNFEEVNSLSSYLESTLKFKIQNYLKSIYLIDKEVNNIENIKYLTRTNICEDCLKEYKFFLYPFNKISKTNNCIKCKIASNNIVYIKK